MFKPQNLYANVTGAAILCGAAYTSYQSFRNMFAPELLQIQGFPLIADIKDIARLVNDKPNQFEFAQFNPTRSTESTPKYEHYIADEKRCFRHVKLSKSKLLFCKPVDLNVDVINLTRFLDIAGPSRYITSGMYRLTWKWSDDKLFQLITCVQMSWTEWLVEINSQELQHQQLTVGTFGFVKYVVDNVPRVSFHEEQFVDVDLTVEQLYNFVYRTDITVKGIGIGSIEYNGTKLGLENAAVKAPFIHKFATLYKFSPKVRSAFPDPTIVHLSPDFSGPVPDVVQGCGTYLFRNTKDGCALPCAPSKGLVLRDQQAEINARQLRQVEPRNKSLKKILLNGESVKLPVKGSDLTVKDLAKEFLELLVPKEHVHTLVPQTEEEVFARQTRAIQVNNREYAKHDLFVRDDEVKVFLKNEPAKIGSVCRIIGSFTPRKAILQGTVYGAVNAYLKNTPHYGFLPPAKLKEALLIINACELKFASDFSKMDATVSKLVRDAIEYAVLMRLFHADYHEFITEVFESTHRSNARGNFLSFKFIDDRISGASDTSSMNTIDSMFMVYVAGRLQGLEPNQVWQLHFLTGGDDVIGAGIQKEFLETAANYLGFEVKAKQLDAEPIDFLAKYVVSVSASESMIIPDPYRCLTSFVVTHITTVPMEQVAYRKGLSFLREYGNNIPILSSMARYFVRRCKYDAKYDQECLDALSYYSRYHALDGSNFNDDDAAQDLDAAYAFVGERLHMGGPKAMLDVEAMYDNAVSDEDLTHCVWCPINVIDIGVPLLYDDTIYTPPPAGANL